MSSKKPIICIMGPTASGKTDLAIELCKQLPCDIISVDSALVYRDMDIGTAKPDQKTLQQAPHRLINIIDPSQHYSAADFAKDAKREINDIEISRKIPLLVGGTLLYFRALLEGLAKMPAADTDVREKIEQQARIEGWQALHNELARVDPVAAKRIHPNDRQRIQRAIEVFRLTGQPISSIQAADQAKPVSALKIALVFEDRKTLHERIEQRFMQMLQNGFENEVRKLYERPDLTAEMPAIRSVGYRQMWGYLSGEYSYEEMIEKGIAASRQLAKRQLTWLRKASDTFVFEPGSTNISEFIMTEYQKF
jgi:tRNA dimethylallyltransferase